MNREHIERLLALYATDSLSDAERKELFAAALQDQALFDQLAEEDSIRELVAMPGAKTRLIASLEEEAPVAAAPAAPSMQWFAWASGLALVFVSGAISYLWLERPSSESQQVATTRPDREPPKPFTPPPVVKEPARVVVDAPPPVASVPRQAVNLPAPIVAPLPAAPPPPPPAPADSRERRAANEGPPREVALARTEADAAGKAKVAEQVVTLPESEKARSSNSFRAAAPASAAPAPKPAKTADLFAKKEAAPQLSAWRRTGDGVWTRIPADMAIERNSTVAVRYTPAANGLYSLTNANGASLISLNGRAGVELEFVLPQSVVTNAPGDSLRLGIRPAQLGAVGGAISNAMRDETKRQAQPGEEITIRLK